MNPQKNFYKRLKENVPGQKISGIHDIKINLEIFFEPLNLKGLKEMHDYSIDDRLYEFLEYDSFKTLQDTRNYIKKLQNRMAENKFKKKAMYWFVRRKKDNLLIGTAALSDINFERKSAEIGYGISPDLWGNVFALQIIETLKHYCFEVLALNRICGKTFIDNKKVINLTKSLSFKKEGIAKEFYFKNYKYIDAYLYSLIKKDYLEIDKAINNKKNIKKNIKKNQIIKIVRSVLKKKEINEQSTIQNTSNWDSLNHVMIISQIIKKTGISILPRQVAEATSIKNICEILEKNKL